MAEPSSPEQRRSRTGSESSSGDGASEYWCFHCDKRVAVETLADVPDLVCCECNGFVEAVSAPSGGDLDAAADLHVFRDEEVANTDRSSEEDEEIGEGERIIRRRERAALRNRLSNIACKSAKRHNQMLDWAEILMEMEDHPIELLPLTPDSSDDYIGDPADYVDEADFEDVLQMLGENYGEELQGTHPASKAAVEALESVVISDVSGTFVCTVCKEMVNVGDITKNLPCGHGYHSDCIIPWLGSRNSCPICRFELPTDDPESEEEKRKSEASSSGLE